MDSEWVHDRFDDDHSHSRPRNSRRRPSPDRDARGSKIKVENLHYELTRDDLEGLFGKIGPVTKVDLIYDRAGRSEGVAYVIYDHPDDAKEAVRQFDGANAKGQPIRLTVLSSAPKRNPFDTAFMPGRSLSDRITRPRSMSPGRYSENERGVDRYVPNGRRSRSPMNRRRGGGRRPGARREAAAQNSGERKPREGRPKKTQEELDAEMASYFNPADADNAAATGQAGSNGAEGAPNADDVDMIE